jgi:hemerythrin-like metal-binding protein
MLEKVDLPEKYKTGHEHIDEQHGHLLSILVALSVVVKNEKKHSLLKIDEEFKALLSDLQQYSKTHFQYEERIMEKIKYPEMENHKYIHAGFIKKLNEVRHECERKRDDSHKLLHEVSTFVKTWYLEHIFIEDKKLVAHHKEVELRTKKAALNLEEDNKEQK